MQQQTQTLPLTGRVYSYLLGCLFIATTLTINGAWANEDRIEEIRVTAHRAPVATVLIEQQFDRDTIATRGRQNGPDLFATLPGFSISRNGAFGSQAQVRVRGSEANHLQVLVDGIEINDPAIGSEYNFAHLNLVGVDRVDYLPGAQSAIWGSDALAGVLNLRTEPTQRTRTVAVTGGSFDTWNPSLRFADRTEQGYYSVAASHYDTEGTNNSYTGSEKDGYTNSHLHLSGGWNLDDWTLRAVLRYTDANTEFDPAPFPISVPVDGDYENNHKSTIGKVEASRQFWDGQLLTQASINYLSTKNDNEVNSVVTDEVDGERLRFDVTTHLRLSDQHALTAILEHQREEFEQTGTPSFFGDPNQTQDGATTSIALEHLGQWDALRTSASIRFDKNDDFDNATSYRLGARYQFNDNWSTEAAVGTGLKNPSFYDRFGFTPNTFSGNSDLEPEENQHVSLSVTYQDDSSRVRATLFRDRLKDEINGFAASATPGFFTAVNTDGTSKRDGLEVTAQTRLVGTDWSLGYTYLDAEGPNGASELRRPEHSGHIQLGSSFAGEKGYWQVGSIFTGEQLDTDFRSFTQVSLDNYSRVHANVSFEVASNWTLRARVENLADDETEDVFMFRPPKRAFYVTIEANL